jgi:hypothetical protein
LYKLRIGPDIPDQVDFGPIDMPIGKMFQEIPEGKYAKLLLQQLGSDRPNPFEVFDGIGQYGWNGLNSAGVSAKITPSAQTTYRTSVRMDEQKLL